MKTLKKTILALGTIAMSTTPLVAVISCSDDSSLSKFTIAIPKQANANFVKYTKSGGIAALYTQTLLSSLPVAEIKDQFQIPRLTISTASGTSTIGGYSYGLIAPSESGDSIKLEDGGTKLTLKLRHDAKWENGKPITAHDIENGFKYVMNFSVGSENEIIAERYGILNAHEAYEEQRAYTATGKSALTDPYSKASPFTHSKDLGVKAIDDSTLQIRFSKPYNYQVVTILNEPIFWPVNKEFVDSIGGIDKFGLTGAALLSSGAYKPSDVDFDYGMKLTKNPYYWNKDKVITDEIIVRFISDNSLQAQLFKDHKIVSSQVPANYVGAYWANKDLRTYLKRGSGLGTLSLLFNGNPNRPNSWLLNNIFFRKALMYGIDRREFMKIIDMDFSVPVGIYTARTMILAKDGEGTDVLSPMVDTHYLIDNGGGHLEDKRLGIVDYQERVQTYKFEDIKRTDTVMDKEMAKYYVKKLFESPEWKAHANPTIEYNYSTQDQQQTKAAIALKDVFTNLFEGKISLATKPSPPSAYTTKFASGDWDLAYKQVDPLSGTPGDYIGQFISEDGVDPSKGKTIGYYTNPTGYMTYKEYFDFLKSQTETFYPVIQMPGKQPSYDKTKPKDVSFEEHTRQLLGISSFIWDFAKSIVLRDFSPKDDMQVPPSKAVFNAELNTLKKELTDYRRANPSDTVGQNRIQNQITQKTAEMELATMVTSYKQWYDLYSGDDFGKGPTLEHKFNYLEETMKRSVTFKTIYPALELIIRDFAPIIPIAEADNTWAAKSLAGAAADKRGWYINPEYGYDVLNPPSKNLPGKEVLKG